MPSHYARRLLLIGIGATLLGCTGSSTDSNKPTLSPSPSGSSPQSPTTPLCATYSLTPNQHEPRVASQWAWGGGESPHFGVATLPEGSARLKLQARPCGVGPWQAQFDTDSLTQPGLNQDFDASDVAGILRTHACAELRAQVLDGEAIAIAHSWVQTHHGDGVVVGYVQFKGKPPSKFQLAGSEVQLHASFGHLKTYTDAAGHFAFRNVPTTKRLRLGATSEATGLPLVGSLELVSGAAEVPNHSGVKLELTAFEVSLDGFEPNDEAAPGLKILPLGGAQNHGFGVSDRVDVIPLEIHPSQPTKLTLSFAGKALADFKLEVTGASAVVAPRSQWATRPAIKIAPNGASSAQLRISRTDGGVQPIRYQLHSAAGGDL